MRVTIIGWYGTETIGDRGIFAGILSFLSDTFGDPTIYLGSLYPFYTRRMLHEDKAFWKKISNNNFEIKLFNSKYFYELDKAIKDSDLLIMGGGPLMHIAQIYMVEYAFKKAKKLGKRTSVLGCGVGPLFTRRHKNSVKSIVDNSDLTILRDDKSLSNLNLIYKEFDSRLEKDIFTSYDPSVEACLKYRKMNETKKKDYIAVNYRKFPIKVSENDISDYVNSSLIEFTKKLQNNFTNTKIKLIPMHYFHFGNDDRKFLAEINEKLNNPSNVSIQKEPLSLEETYREFSYAKFAIGMRYHSVVFQTILNGNNYILDYTEPKKGKIAGFLKDIDEEGFYNNRYCNLQKSNISFPTIKDNNKAFEYNKSEVESRLSIYKNGLKKLFK